jgi:glutamate-1-semialdehyde 2,1-aminomutase
MPITATLDDLVADLESAYRAATPRSHALHTRAAGVMPGGDTRTGTFHLPWPIVMARGQGSRLWDEDGREYIDFLSNFTSLIHGHAHPAVTAAIVKQAGLGTAHGSPTALMTELAERIHARFPSVERLRFCNSGTESALFAIRAARAFTGRSLILKMEGGYHGSYDHVQVAQGTANAPGLSPAAVAEVVVIPFNDAERAADVFAKRGHEIAAVIIEPMMMSGGCLPRRAGVHPGAPADGATDGLTLHLRRSRDVPARLRRRAGGLRYRARSHNVRQGHRRGTSGGRVWRPR